MLLFTGFGVAQACSFARNSIIGYSLSKGDFGIAATITLILQLIETMPQGWQAVAFHFSKLLEHYRSEYQIKIATNLMNDLLGDRDGAIYLCEDSTIYVMVKNFPKSLTEKMIFQLRYLFMDDPLSYTAEGDENPA